MRKGGRQKGTPNKATQSLLELIHKKWPKYHPVAAMAAIANDDEVSLEMRFRAHSEVAQYLVPKRKAVEVDFGPTAETIIYDVLGRDRKQ